MDAIYFKPDEVGSFGGVRPLAVAAGETIPAAKKWLSAQDAYTLHKPVVRNFKRRTTISMGIDNLWQSDLVDLSSLARHNDNVRYLLTVIDVFSKKARVIPLKSKTGKAVSDAFDIAIREKKPMFLQTDKGTEFKNSTFQRLLSENGIKFYTSENDDIKCSVVERFNRTLKSRMFRYFTYKNTRRYIDVLPQLVRAYNSSYHRSIKTSPDGVTSHNEDDVRAILYPATKTRAAQRYRFEVGDKVRISFTRRAFRKGYLPNWSTEIFSIIDKFPTTPPTYGIVDYNGDPLEGKFYAQELQRITKEDDTYKVERIIDTRKRGGRTEYLVKWLGYPTSFNSWTRDIIRL